MLMFALFNELDDQNSASGNEESRAGLLKDQLSG